MKRLLRGTSFRRAILLVLPLTLLLGARGWAQNDDSVHVSNVRFEMSGNKVLIHFDLLSNVAGSGRLKTPSRPSTGNNEGDHGKSIGQLIASVSNDSREDAPAVTDRQFKIAILLRKESDPLFRFKPRKVTGDIGIIRSTGRNKQIVWDIGKEFSQGIDGNDFYFEVQAEVLTKSNSSVWWIGGSAAVLAGGIVTYLVLSGGKVGQPSPADFPPPPGRPR